MAYTAAMEDGLVYKILAAAWWALIGAGAVYFMTYKAPEPPQKAAPKAELQIKDRKTLGPNEELRVIWMPSGIESLGARCLLYTKNETAAISCGTSDIMVE